jgi:hypothetical protein
LAYLCLEPGFDERLNREQPSKEESEEREEQREGTTFQLLLREFWHAGAT